MTMNTISSVMVLSIVWILQTCQCTEGPSIACPINTTLVGDNCLFILKERGNFTENRQYCATRNASLLTLSSVQNLIDVCKYIRQQLKALTINAYLGANQDQNNMAEYLWHHDNSSVNFPRKYWMDKKPERLACIEIFLFKNNYCRINDIVCWRWSWAVCEYQNHNICLENNGNCQQTCVPREFRTRTCKCVTGIKVNETKCVKDTVFSTESVCPHGFIKYYRFSRAGICVKLDKSKRDFDSAVNYCNETYNSSLLTFNKDSFPRVCKYLIQYTGEGSMFWMGIRRNSNPKVWIYDREPYDDTAYVQRRPHVDKDPFSQVQAVLVGENRCFIYNTMHTKTFGVICQRPPFAHPCRYDNGGCIHKCVYIGGLKAACLCSKGYLGFEGNCTDVDECESDNGGCHHICHNTIGGFNCACKRGYFLDKFFHTECKVECKDETAIERYELANPKCECLPGYTLINGIVCLKDAIDVNPEDTEYTPFFLLNFLWVLIAIIICSLLVIKQGRKPRVQTEKSNVLTTSLPPTKSLTSIVTFNVTSVISSVKSAVVDKSSSINNSVD